MDQTSLETKPSLALNRHYPIAPEKVWRAWTDPQALKRWFGPGGPDGKEHEAAGVYKEVVPVPKKKMAAYRAMASKDRDRVLAKVMKDKRLAPMMNPKAMPFDGKRMFYGGFKVMVAL